MLETLLEAIQETLVMFPFLFLAYLCIEYFEHKGESCIKSYMKKANALGIVLGAIFGIIPQCSFSVVASSLFVNGHITLGTLLAVFIATSDEALLILMTHPQQYRSLITIVIIKMIIGVLVGYTVDFLMTKHQFSLKAGYDYHDTEKDHHSLLYTAFIHTMKIFLFVLGVNVLLSLLIENVGTKIMAVILGKNTFFQPFISALFGLIPNCIASVVLSQLYIEGVVSFASLCAGLITSSGLGLLVLWKMCDQKKDILKICGILYCVGVLSGIVLSFITKI